MNPLSFFVLTNTRARSPKTAEQITREVCQNLKLATPRKAFEDFLVVSRSDSTLRGHYPIETDAIAEALGPFDAHFLIPAFFEGGARHPRQHPLFDGGWSARPHP